MALSDKQIRQLKAKLNPRHVRVRQSNGADLHYVEGWHVVAEANRIFGFDAWDRRTVASHCIWSGSSDGSFAAVYTARVRICVRAGDDTVVRDGSGSGEGTASTRGQAHDLALKAAETDGTKRALSTFGNPFGLALYDPAQNGVRASKKGVEEKLRSWTMRSANGKPTTVCKPPSDFVEALKQQMRAAPDIETLFELWEHNLETVRALDKATRRPDQQQSAKTTDLVGHLKSCAAALAAPNKNSSDAGKQRLSDSEGAPAPKPVNSARQRVDKSALTISEPKRIRSKEHLKFVAGQPCVICGRKPSHAHHLRHAQSRGLSLKVSDEFTVPLCAIHDDAVHRVGKEETWWREQNVDPLSIAKSLWDENQGVRGKREVASGSAGPPTTQIE